MKEQLLRRTEQLKSELESGQKMLAELDAKRASLQQALLRISGAIQVLEEECAKQPASAAEPAAKREEAAPRIAVAN